MKSLSKQLDFIPSEIADTIHLTTQGGFTAANYDRSIAHSFAILYELCSKQILVKQNITSCAHRIALAFT